MFDKHDFSKISIYEFVKLAFFVWNSSWVVRPAQHNKLIFCLRFLINENLERQFFGQPRNLRRPCFLECESFFGVP